MDLATILIIFATTGDSNLKNSNSVLSIWIHTPNMFPFHHMSTIICRRQENEVSILTIVSKFRVISYFYCLCLIRFGVVCCLQSGIRVSGY